MIQERRQLGMYDAWVAATASALGYTLIARDRRFDDIPDLRQLSFTVTDDRF